MKTTTLSTLLLERVRETPHAIAYRSKKLGIYQERTWQQLGHLVGRCAMGLAGLGLAHGERCAFLADPVEEYAIAELAALSLGAVTYGIYPTSSKAELLHLLEDGKALVLVAGNQEYLDRVLPLCPGLPGLRRLVVIDRRGMLGYDDPSVVAYETLLEEGEKEMAARPGTFEETAGRVKPSDGLFIAYTSGTTGRPKGVLVSHGKHLAATQALVDHYPLLREPQRTVVYLPFPSALGRLAALTLPLLVPLIPHYGEDVDEPGQTFFEVAPTVLFAAPHYLKKISAGIRLAIENSSPAKKLAYTTALCVGRRHLRKVWEGKRNPLFRAFHRICYYAVFRPILNKIGFDQLKLVVSTGTRLPEAVMTLWQVYGVNLSEMYGLTEAGGGIVAAQGAHFPKPGNVGKPLGCFEVKLSGRGEVLVRGEEIFDCYWNNPDLTEACRTAGGWLCTDDAGEWTPDGRLRILDRVADTLEGGSPRSSLTVVESALKSSPYVSEAVVIGSGSDYLSALIEIDFDAVSDWASRHRITFTGNTGLIEHPAIVAHIGSEIETVNKGLGPYERVESFRIIPGVLNPAEEEAAVTATRKIRRQAIHKKFTSLIESMHRENKEKQGGAVC